MKPGQLARTVARIWESAGYETGIDRRDGHTYVIARREDRDALIRVVALGSDHVLTRSAIREFRGSLSEVSVDEAYVVTDGKIRPEVEEIAKSAGIVTIDGSNLERLATESGIVTRRQQQQRDGTASAATAGDEGSADATTATASGSTGPASSGTSERRNESAGSSADGDESASGSSDDGSTIGAEASEEADEDDDETEADDGEVDDGGVDDEGSGDGLDLDDEPEIPSFDQEASPFGETEGEEEAEETAGRSRRGILVAGGATGGAVLTFGLLDWAFLHVLFGGGGASLPSYNETRVKREAAPVPVRSFVGNAENMAGTPVTYEATLLDSYTKSGLEHLRLVVRSSGDVVIGRWDGEVPSPGTQLTVWGVFKGLTTPPNGGGESGGDSTTTAGGGGSSDEEAGGTTAGSDKVPMIDIVDMKTASSGGDGSGTTTDGS